MGLLKQGSPIRGFDESEDMLGTIIGIIGGVVAIIIGIGTILGWFVFLGSWKSKIDSLLNQENECFKVVPLAVQDLKTKMDLVWQVQTLEVLERQKLVLHHEGPFTERHSPLKITDRGQKCLDELRPLIADIEGRKDLLPSDVLRIAHEKIGMKKLDELAHSQNCSVNEILALLTVHLGFGL